MCSPVWSGARFRTSGSSRMRKPSQAAQKGPDARRRPPAAREAYSLYVERATKGANCRASEGSARPSDGLTSDHADGPFSAACQREERPMTQFIKVATTEEFGDQQAKLVAVEGQRIALFRVDGAFYALHDACPHRGGPLSKGTVKGAEVICPWHDASFDIRTGA